LVIINGSNISERQIVLFVVFGFILLSATLRMEMFL